MKRARMCVYLDVELSKWIKDNAIINYRSFSSFLNKLMLDYKDGMELNSSVRILKSETRK